MKLDDLRKEATSGIVPSGDFRKKTVVNKKGWIFNMKDPTAVNSDRRVTKCKCGKLISIKKGFSLCPKCGFDHNLSLPDTTNQINAFEEITKRFISRHLKRVKKKKK